MAIKRKRETKEVRQQQIVDAAQKLISKYGTEHLTVKRIATEVGISEAAIYRHFKSKKSILSFLLINIENVLINDILRRGTCNETMTLAIIEKTLQNHFSIIDLRKGMGFRVIAEISGLGDKSLSKKTAALISKYISNLRALLAEGVKSGCVRKDIDLDAAAMVLFSVIQSLVNVWVLNDCSFPVIEKYTSLWQIFREAVIPR